MAAAAASLSLPVAAQQPIPRPAAPKAAPPKAIAKPVIKPPTPEEKALAEERQRIKLVWNSITKANSKFGGTFRAGQIPEGEKPELEQYFDNYIDVLLSPGGALEVPDARSKLRSSVMRQIGNAADKSGLVYLNALALGKLGAAASAEKNSPHGRYNCMLAIGELNELEPTQGGSGPVKPLPQALPVLLAAVAQADTPAAVKVAALIGIQRHAKLGIADKNVERQVVTELAKLIQQTTPPTDVGPDGHHWMRRQAIDVLGQIKQPGAGNEVVNALVGIVGEKANPRSVRLEAMRALGQFKVPANAMGDTVSPTVGAMTLDLLKNEPNRRALRQGFLSLLIGLKGAPNGQGGILASVSGSDKKKADELGQKVAVLVAIVAAADDAQAAQQIPIEAASFEFWLKGEQDPAAAAAATGDAPD